MASEAPEIMASQWVPGSGPAVVAPVSAGIVNQTFRVQRAGRAYALRTVAAAVPEFEIDRDWECRVLACAADAGLAPRVHRCDAARGLLVTDWVGRAPEADRSGADGMLCMAELLRQVHSLAPRGAPRRLGPAEWIERYSGALAREALPSTLAWASPRALEALAAAAKIRLERLATFASSAVLCHGDLHRDNVVGGAPAQLIDWEYAHVTDPFWDVAGWIANNDGDECFARDFLTAYLQQPPSAGEVERLELLGWLYDYVCLLWSGVYASRCTLERAAAVAVRAGQLAARLGRAGGSGSAAGSRAGQLPAH
jgi:aminoglycoside phosphotransferase (APT) family kinase protein